MMPLIRISIYTLVRSLWHKWSTPAFVITVWHFYLLSIITELQRSHIISIYFQQKWYLYGHVSVCVCIVETNIPVFAWAPLLCWTHPNVFEKLETNLFVFMCSPVGRMAMQFVAAQMMSTVWNGPSSSQVMKPPVSLIINTNDLCPALNVESCCH